MLRKINTLSFIIFILFLNCSEGISQSVSKYAGEFLEIGVGARSQALGASFVSIADDGSAIYWNPAGIIQIKSFHTSLMHAEQYGGEINYDFAGVVFPHQDKYAFGLGLIRLGIDGIPDTRNALIDTVISNGKIDDGERLNLDKVTYFSNADYALYFSFAHRRSDRSCFGANIKMIRRNIGDNSAWGVGFDFGGLFKFKKYLSFGFNLMDATTTLISWDTNRKELISPKLKLGAAYTYDSNRIPVKIIPVVETDIRFENRDFSSIMSGGFTSIDPHFGLGMIYNDMVSLRFGYDDIKRTSAGLGVTVSGINIDYAFTAFDEFKELGNSHKISLS
ncbi:PorV/PorQ family protein, partial [candidate division KSB1 bacterium]